MELNYKGLIRIGCVLTIETYAVLKMASMVNKERKKIKTLENKLKTYKMAVDLYEVANESLSKEIDELKRQESV